MALSLHAVTVIDSVHESHVLQDGARAVAYRDLAAIVTEREKFGLDDLDQALIDQHRMIVDRVFKTQAVLPTPAGIVFRTEHVLTRWMELHYVALTDALAFVSDRLVARVHVSRAGGKQEDKDVGTGLAEAASGIFRELRRRAVASVPLTTEHITGVVLSGAFLVERELWAEFEGGFTQQREANPDLDVELTGPWAPYDFVRMQLGN